MTITATNLEHAVEIRVPGDCKRPGRVTVPARILSSLVQATREEKIEMEVKQGNLFVSSDSRQSRVNGMSGDDFPLIPKIKKTAEFSLLAADAAPALAHVLPAVSSSDFKPELGGVFLKTRQNEITLAATDTFRLAEHHITLKKTAPSAFSCIVPQRVCQEMARISADYGDEVVRVASGDNQIAFEAGPVRVTSRLIEGAFPEYRAIIPTQFKSSAFIARDEMLSAVRSSGIFVSKLQEVMLRMSEGSLEVVSSNPEIGEYRTTIKANTTGEEAAISFNYRYLMDGIQALEDDEVFFGMSDASAPALLRNKSTHAFTYVVMPIRLT